MTKEKIKAKNRAWYLRNRKLELIKDGKYQREKMKHDVNYRLRRKLRVRLYMATKNNQKIGSAVKDLGCSIEFFKQYIESKFYENMTWNNWGKVWQLDHIKELNTFDLTNKEQFKKAVHYTNLQPLTIEDHRYKTSKDTIFRRN
jgi:hypothetical protein